MPGSIDLIEAGWVHGWARHPVHADYPMTVHAISEGRVVATVLADVARQDGMPGFALPLAGISPLHLRVLLGETDEELPHAAQGRVERRLRTVEDLLAESLAPRKWVTGACHIEARKAGLHPQTIIDLLCRDILGRAAGRIVIATALAQCSKGGYDAVRRMLLDSSEYKYRRIYADRAPGAIFSHDVVLAAAQGDFVAQGEPDAPTTSISATPLLALDTEAFVTACYRQILRKEPDRPGMAHYLGQLASGVSKAAIIRHLGGEFETISAGITIVDLPAED